MNNILSDNYTIIKKIGSGSFGEVYLAQHKDGGYVAAKIEDKNKSPRVYNEYKIYKYLHKKGFKIGLPQVYDFIETTEFNIMCMELLGSSLDDMFNECNKKFTIPTVLTIGLQLITLLETLHDCSFIHRDIKPNNFLLDVENKNQLYIMDFGLSKKYINQGKHMRFRSDRSLIGTARYASINMHMGIEPSRRDDLESVGYMLIYFLLGRLPWQGLKKKKGRTNLELIGEVKMCTNIAQLCTGLPSCFHEYLYYCRNLKFDETPNYEYLRHLFFSTNSNLQLEWIK